MSRTAHICAQAPMDPDELQFVNFLNDWPDGTPKIFGNGFTAHMDGRPSVFVQGRAFIAANSAGASASQVATETREKIEAGGRNIGTILGLSKKTALTQEDAKRYHVTVSQGA